VRKFLLLIFAIITIAAAIFSYDRYYARNKVSRMLGEARLAASTKTALSLNRHLKDAELEVSVSENATTLSGVVRTEIQKSLAGEVALSIKGVKEVHNNVIVSRTVGASATAPERTLGERLDDLTIEASVKTALALNEYVSSRKISVKSDRGHVVLEGKTSSAAEAELARKIAEDVEGVRSVEFRLALEDVTEEKTGRSILQKVDDVRVSALVRAAFMVNRNLDSSEIEIVSENGIVRLNGIVRSGAEKDLAQKIAEDCKGVKAVDNELRISAAGG
jgi:osmotically-inducible protein OsmY